MGAGGATQAKASTLDSAYTSFLVFHIKRGAIVPRTKSRVRKDYASLEQAWTSGGELEVTRQAVRKYTQVIDVTESGRDIKPLISGMFEAIYRLKALEQIEESENDTPYAQIMREAEAALENA